MTSEDPQILVVDDDEDISEVFRLTLDEYSVITAVTGSEALNKFSEQIDVVLLDRQMPGMSGQEVLAEIRRQDPGVRVAMITSTRPDQEALDTELDAYLMKPVKPTMLRSVVAEMLTLSEYDDVTSQFFSLAKQKARLEAAQSSDELATDVTYQRLEQRVTEVSAKAAAVREQIGGNQFEKVLSGLSYPQSELS